MQVNGGQLPSHVMPFCIAQLRIHSRLRFPCKLGKLRSKPKIVACAAKRYWLCCWDVCCAKVDHSACDWFVDRAGLVVVAT